MSLRSRLVLGMLLVAVVLVATSLTITRTTRSYLVGQVDDQLQSTALRTFGFPGGQGGFGPPGQGPVTNDDRAVSPFFLAYVRDDGTLAVVLTPNVTDESLALPDLNSDDVALADDVAARTFSVGSVGSSARYRVLVQRVRVRDDTRVQVTALPLADVDSTLGRLVRVELATTLAILGLLALVTFWVLRLGVRPIKSMTAAASAIAAGDLSHRVPGELDGTESGELGVALNAMLDRIEESFDQKERSEARLRRFAADASHELRTPITTIRGYAELYRRGGLEGEGQLPEAMRRTEQEAVRMGRLVEDLLMLARLDQGRPLEVGPVDLAQIARDAAADAHAVQPERPITVEADGPLIVEGDDGRVRQVVANLVSNALVHTDQAVPVALAARREGDLAVLEVRDQGPGMPADIAEQAFERFYRADPSRARNRGGTGLGLSITQAIVEAHGGQVFLATAPGQGTAIRVELPCPSSDGPSAP